ncbi:DUF2255 family protein [Amycolatopsis pithecellobii]|uniref:DUF2255 family protein n=1 Tax=Amycolatopsis pithecellobii TaxID=664692 RepID=A0A6N7Z4W2_9PSEU|nr:DUF2255 family protein [Amycolatopsis pithecellobii]MTD55430.1 DUF2255 family protein [Amycolatopsis pithecellobii]
MSLSWSPDDLRLIDKAGELEIAVKRSDGGLRPWIPIWVVCVGGQVYVRTWFRRDTGWFGHALRSRNARIRVPGLEADVAIQDIGDTWTDITDDVDAAYRTKYGRGGAGSMVTAAATATTLRLDPGRAPKD